MCKRPIYILLLLLCTLSVRANDTIAIPLKMSVFRNMPMDGPTGSTPDPTDPNQFRASLTGNNLFIQTQSDAVSFVVIQRTSDSWQSEEYFSALSYDSLSCPITQTGLYTIRIGCWKTDFIGRLEVRTILLADLNGHYIRNSIPQWSELPPGVYILRVETSLGSTSSKFYKRL